MDANQDKAKEYVDRVANEYKTNLEAEMADEHRLPRQFTVTGERPNLIAHVECSCGLPFMVVGATESVVMTKLLAKFRKHEAHPRRVPKGWERVTPEVESEKSPT